MDGFALTLDSLRAWCERQNLRCLHNAELGQLAIPRLIDRDAPIRIIPRPDRRMMTFAMLLPFQVPEDRYEAVSRAATLANSSSFMGAWVLNSQRGELYFRITLPTSGALYDDEGIRFVVQVLVGTVDTLANAFHQVAVEGADFQRVLDVQREAAAPEAEA